MKEFIQVLRRFVPPYKKFLGLSILFNVLSAVLNIFSFAALIPILQIIFKTGEAQQAAGYMAWDWNNVQTVAMNNMNYYVSGLIDDYGQTATLLMIGMFLAVTTLLKTGCYFLTSAMIVPLRTGIVRDIRNQLYEKITSLPLGFFTSERKGDIIARMTGDVGEVEASIMSSLDMLFKNPVLIIAYFTTLLVISWQLTLFTLLIVPLMGWIMGLVGRKLKAQSAQAQQMWSDTMSQVEETLGGLRIIKAFCAEDKMNRRFDNINSTYRQNLIRVAMRQSLAHPMSEFLGTVMIVIVLWFGGLLVLKYETLSGPTFIYYMVILYSIINPLKEFAKAGYSIPKGLASMERVDKILRAENTIREKPNPTHIDSFDHQIEFRHGHQPRHTQGKDHCAGGAERQRQVDNGRPDTPLLRCAEGRGAYRRHQRQGPGAPRPASADRKRQPGGHPFQRFVPQQHHFRCRQCHSGAGGRGRTHRQCA